MKRRKDRRRHELSKLNALVKYQEQRSFRPIRGADVLASCAFRDRRRIRSDDSTPRRFEHPARFARRAVVERTDATAEIARTEPPSRPERLVEIAPKCE